MTFSRVGRCFPVDLLVWPDGITVDFGFQRREAWKLGWQITMRFDAG